MSVFKAISRIILIWFISFPILSAELSIESLKNHYGNLNFLSAQIEQKKTAPYLFKPLVSKILLQYSKNEIHWNILTPIKSQIVIDSKGLRILDAGGSESGMNIPQNDKAKVLVNFFKDLFSLDFDRIQKNFTLGFGGLTLTAVPLKGSDIPYIEKLRFVFSKDLNLKSLFIDSKDESIEMSFSKVIVKK